MTEALNKDCLLLRIEESLRQGCASARLLPSGNVVADLQDMLEATAAQGFAILGFCHLISLVLTKFQVGRGNESTIGCRKVDAQTKVQSSTYNAPPGTLDRRQ